MEIPIIEKGRREGIRLFRNLTLIILAIGIVFLVCSVLFEFAESIRYEVVLLILMVLLVSVISTIPLFIRKKIGCLMLNTNGTIHIRTGKDDFSLEGVTIALNADKGELRDAKHDITKVRRILSYGNYLEGVALADEQTCELILTKKAKEYLVTWYSPLLKERFDSRPFIHESPPIIVHRILDIMQPF